MKVLNPFALALVLLAFCWMPSLAGWFGWIAAASSKPSLAPSFVLKDLSGNVVDSANFLGKPVLIDFWAAWCDSCKTALPFYQSLYAKNGAQGFVVLGINEGDDHKTAARSAADEGVSYLVLLDVDKKAFYSYGARGLPTAFLLDRKGLIRGRWFGFNPAQAADIKAKVSTLVSERRRP